MTNNVKSDYTLEVIEPWDQASWNFKKHCKKANKKVSIAKYFKRKGWNYELRTKWIEKLSEGIDWVGTKMQIYTNRFNFLVKKNIEWKIDDQTLFDECVKIWERMLYDLIAMNLDDLRKWEMGLAITNIIDINNLNWRAWKLFSDSMGQALENVIEKIDIAITAWETAILWNPQSTKKLNKILDNIIIEINWVLNKSIKTPDWVKRKIEKILKEWSERRDVVLEDIEFNVWWTWVWAIWKWEKLVEMEDWQIIMYLQEKPTEKWIIWPRSNWITAIRDYMTQLAWDWWENLSFEEFLETIWEEKSKLLPDELKKNVLDLICGI